MGFMACVGCARASVAVGPVTRVHGAEQHAAAPSTGTARPGDGTSELGGVASWAWAWPCVGESDVSIVSAVLVSTRAAPQPHCRLRLSFLVKFPLVFRSARSQKPKPNAPTPPALLVSYAIQDLMGVD